MSPPRRGGPGFAQVVQVLVRLLEVWRNKRPWGEIAQAFNAMPEQVVRQVMQEHPEVFAGHLRDAVSEKQQPAAQAVLAALGRIPHQDIRDFSVIAALCFAAPACEGAAAFVRAFGAQRALRACVSQCSESDRAAKWFGACGLMEAAKLELPGRDAALSRSLRELCQALPKTGHLDNWQPYFAVCAVVCVLLEEDCEIPELEARLVEISRCPRLVETSCDWKHEVLEALIGVIRTVKDRCRSGPYPDSSGRRQSMPGARSFIVSLMENLWAYLGCGDYQWRQNVLEALDMFGADEVADVVVHDFLPPPAERGMEEKPCWDSPLSIAASMLAKDPAATRVHDVLAYCREVLLNSPPGKERAQWPLGMLVILGCRGGAGLIWEFHMQPGRERLGSWDFCASGSFAAALKGFSPAESQPHLNAVLDAQLSEDRHLSFEAGCIISSLCDSRFVELCILALNRLEAQSGMAPESQARLLWALCANASHGFLLSESTLGRAVDAALSRKDSAHAGLRGGAYAVLTNVLRSIFARDWRGWGPHIDHPRREEIADAAVLAFGDEDQEIRKRAHYTLCESTHDIRGMLMLVLLKAALDHPEKPGVRKVLAEACSYGGGYVSEKMLGLRTGHPERLKDAVLSLENDMHELGTVVFCRVLAVAPEDLRQGLLEWLKEQSGMPRERRRKVLPVVLQFAVRCPELAGQHEWILDQAARCVSWREDEKLRILTALCGKDPQRLEALVRRHRLDLLGSVPHGDAAQLGALLAAVI